MRDDWPPRGEARRVADRVRAVLAAAGPDGGHRVDEPDDDDGPDLGATGFGAERFGAYGFGADPGSSGRRASRRRPLRLDPGRRAALGISVVVVLAAIITGVWLTASRPAPVPVSARAPSVPAGPLVDSAGRTVGASGAGVTSGAAATAGNATVSSSAASSNAGLVVVDVAGKVVHPGLYRLPAGSRVDDAIKAAGGARPGVDLASLNLAAPVSDGQQIAVGRPGASGAVGGGDTAATGSIGSTGATVPGGRVDLNTASLSELDGLPGVGPVLAQHILDWRSEHGQFASVDQLNDVSGIGDVKFAELRDLVSV